MTDFSVQRKKFREDFNIFERGLWLKKNQLKLKEL